MTRPLAPLTSIALLVGLIALTACQEPAASTAKPARPVEVQRVAFGHDGTRRDFVGVVRARYETDLGFRVAGKIITRHVNVGDRVHAGEVVAQLDPQDFKLQVRRLKELGLTLSLDVGYRLSPRGESYVNYLRTGEQHERADRWLAGPRQRPEGDRP